jgi:hypothetical protein
MKVTSSLAKRRLKDALGGQPIWDVDSTSDMEKRTDLFAESLSVDKREMNNFIARVRPLYSKQEIKNFAARIGCSSPKPRPRLETGRFWWSRREYDYRLGTARRQKTLRGRARCAWSAHIYAYIKDRPKVDPNYGARW